MECSAALVADIADFQPGYLNVGNGDARVLQENKYALAKVYI